MVPHFSRSLCSIGSRCIATPFCSFCHETSVDSSHSFRIYDFCKFEVNALHRPRLRSSVEEIVAFNLPYRWKSDTVKKRGREIFFHVTAAGELPRYYIEIEKRKSTTRGAGYRNVYPLIAVSGSFEFLKIIGLLGIVQGVCGAKKCGTWIGLFDRFVQLNRVEFLAMERCCSAGSSCDWLTVTQKSDECGGACQMPACRWNRSQCVYVREF